MNVITLTQYYNTRTTTIDMNIFFYFSHYHLFLKKFEYQGLGDQVV
jgi:hypothetical protein